MPQLINQKVFCIGFNKTGTTSMGAVLQSIGYTLGDQGETELLLEDWGRRDFRRLLKLCETANAFQDIPFSLADTYAALDKAFARSKFVLTVRSTSQEWFESLTQFQTKLIGQRRLPTAADLQAFPYREPGWLWKTHQLIFDATEATLYDPAQYIAKYEAHCAAAKDYFRDRPADFLVLNLAEPGAMGTLCAFLGVERTRQAMPHLNQSRGHSDSIVRKCGVG